MSAGRTPFRLPLPSAAALADAALLWGVAAVIVWLGWSGNYGMFLNPRFLWLSLLAGAALAVLGVAALLRGDAGPRAVPPRRALLLGLLLCVTLTATVDWWGAGAVSPQGDMVAGSLGGGGAAGPASAGPGGDGRDLSDSRSHALSDVRPDARYDDPSAFAGPSDAWEASGKPGPFDDAPVASGDDDELGPRAMYADKEYVRINVAELFLLERRNRPEELEGRYVFRGAVTRHPSLDARQSVAVFRVSLYCCLADATAGGFVVRPGAQEAAEKRQAVGGPVKVEAGQPGTTKPERTKSGATGTAQAAPAPTAPAPGTALALPVPAQPVPASRDILAGLRDGQWVEVYGRLTREKLPDKLTRLAPREVFSGALNSGWVFTADAVRLIPPPSDPFIFQWREAEPYLW